MFKRLLCFMAVCVTASFILGFGSIPLNDDHAELINSSVGGIGTSGGTTGGSPTGDYDTTVVTLYGIDEKRSTDSYKRNGSSVDHLTNRHVVGLDYLITHTSGTNSDPAIKHQTTITGVYALDGTEMRSGGGTNTSQSIGHLGTTYNVVGQTIGSSGHVYIQTSSTGAIAGGQVLKFIVRTSTTVEYWNPSTPNAYSSNSQYYEVQLDKLTVDDSSIDTRRTFGQANVDGELPADPNAPLREMNFGPWTSKGGLFIGNMPAGGKDMSGTARIQLYVNGGSSYSTYEFATLSMYDLGKPADPISGTMDIGLYMPLSNSTSESTVTWANKWAIDPEDVDPLATQWDSAAFCKLSFSGGALDDYVCFRLSGAAGALQPANCLKWLCLGVIDEDDWVAANNQAWRYFASKEYQRGSTYPLNDIAPRVWVAVCNVHTSEVLP